MIFIYLLMGFLFESFILPLSIILTIPLSLDRRLLDHFVMGKDIDFLGFVAIVLLIGVVVNNGIVLIDYVNRLRNQGYVAQAEALLTATGRRFRPIMMTAITTIGGLIPLAFAGSTSIGISYTSFAMTLIGGMTTATLLTLLVVPDLLHFLRRRPRGLRRRSGPRGRPDRGRRAARAGRGSRSSRLKKGGPDSRSGPPALPGGIRSAMTAVSSLPEMLLSAAGLSDRGVLVVLVAGASALVHADLGLDTAGAARLGLVSAAAHVLQFLVVDLCHGISSLVFL